ncbi:DUF269 domain-containing protein [Rhizobium grahamii]|uniref:DUF269 domain-containing protein n=1 Tax=Rhizobium grahamii TaxID=1120045 RepID=UPI0011475387|nr:DUF269 domain-containing protein [Rhizobium grahamii]
MKEEQGRMADLRQIAFYGKGGSANPQPARIRQRRPRRSWAEKFNRRLRPQGCAGGHGDLPPVFLVEKGKNDQELLSDYVVTKEQRRAMAIIGDPDSTLLSRIQLFYTCIACGVEERSSLQTSSLMTINHDGFGRVVMTGRLVALSKTPRDVHRFGFGSKLSGCGEALVGHAMKIIFTFPDVARAKSST